jgi:DNA-binding SARP family transcriptional activator/tetratricopeptide (TPR) repeat protein
MDPKLEFRILGPLELLVNGVATDISAPRQRTLLAVLILEANHVVSVSRLIDALWEGEPPETARSQVQICISSLRTLLGSAHTGDIVVTQAPGYQLQVDPEAIDAVRFERLVATGRLAAAEARLDDAVRDLRAALGLWRGPAASLERHVVQAAATRLNEERIAVAEQCLGLELQLGRHTEVIGELTVLIAEHPLREKLRAHHMLGLYRAGRQAEALDAFRHARHDLVDQLGIEPGEDLRQLEHAILKNDPGLDMEDTVRGRQVSAIVPRQLPADIGDFVGRQDITEQLLGLLRPSGHENPSRSTPIAVLSGMGGIGKTALAVHVGHLLDEEFPEGQLFIELGSADSHAARDEQRLQFCLRALGVAPVSLPSSLDELMAMYRSLLATRRMLIVLDNAVSAAQVAPLIPGSQNCAVIVTSRQRLTSLVGANFFEVEVLPVDAAVQFLSRSLGDIRAREADVTYLAELCGFLPLALRIVAAKLLDHPHWAIHQMTSRLEDEKQRLAELEISGSGIKASISLSYDALTGDAKRLFLGLSLLGSTDFATWIGVPLLNQDIDQVQDLLDQLVGARLVEVRIVADGPARLHQHELVRAFAIERAAIEQPINERIATLNRILGCWLFLTSEAHERGYGGSFSILRGSSKQYTLPDHMVEGLLCDPLRWLRAERRALISAISRAAESGLDEFCWNLATTAVTLFEAESLFDDWRQSHEVALKVVRRAGNRRGEAALLCSLGELALDEGGLGAAANDLHLAARIFAEIGDVHGRALATSHLAFIERLKGHGDGALALYSSTIEALRAVGDQVAEAHALSGVAQVYIERKQYAIAERLLNTALSICREVEARRVQVQVVHGLGEAYIAQGRIKPAIAMFESVLQAARAGGDRPGEAYALHSLGAAQTQTGNHDAAAASLAAALVISRELGTRILRGRILMALGELSAARGFNEPALALLTEALDILRKAGAVVLQARVLVVCGRLHEAAGRHVAAVEAQSGALQLIADTDPALAASIEDDLARR